MGLRVFVRRGGGRCAGLMWVWGVREWRLGGGLNCLRKNLNEGVWGGCSVVSNRGGVG